MVRSFYAYISALICFMGALGHAIQGGRVMVDPLLHNEHVALAHSSMIWMVWHVVSVTFLCMAYFYFYGGLKKQRTLIHAANILTVAIGLVGLLAPLYLQVGYTILPNGLVFIPIALFGFLSLSRKQNVD